LLLGWPDNQLFRSLPARGWRRHRRWLVLGTEGAIDCERDKRSWNFLERVMMREEFVSELVEAISNWPEVVAIAEG
jgi:hypothetical protein